MQLMQPRTNMIFKKHSSQNCWMHLVAQTGIPNRVAANSTGNVKASKALALSDGDKSYVYGIYNSQHCYKYSSTVRVQADRQALQVIFASGSVEVRLSPGISHSHVPNVALVPATGANQFAPDGSPVAHLSVGPALSKDGNVVQELHGISSLKPKRTKSLQLARCRGHLVRTRPRFMSVMVRQYSPIVCQNPALCQRCKAWVLLSVIPDISCWCENQKICSLLSIFSQTSSLTGLLLVNNTCCRWLTPTCFHSPV